MRSQFPPGLTTGLLLLAAGALAACTGGVSVPLVPLVTAGFTVSGSVSGLTGSGLTLQNNSSDALVIRGNGPFTFPTALFSGNAYSVSVSTQPGTPAQTCVVNQGSGNIGSANVTNVSVSCTDKASPLDSIGGTVVGLAGSGLVLQNNAADTLTVSNGAFTFATALASGMPYNVTVLSAPLNPYQDCTVANGSGITASSDVNNVAISCTTNSNPTHTVGGTLSGLTAAQGTIVLQNNGRDNLTLSADGPFTFALPIPSGSFYNVTSLSLQGPNSFTCAFTNGSGQVGSGNVTNVSVVCTLPVRTPITVNVSGLAGAGLVLQDNGADNLNIAVNGTSIFATALTVGSAYNVTVLTQPSAPSQSCVIANGTGTVVAGTTVVATLTCTSTVFSEWTWESGASVNNAFGVYGALGIAASGNAPGARYSSATFTDPAGRLWLFGGQGYGASGAPSLLNDLWRYDPTTIQWTWMGGASATGAAGVYGTQGTAAAANIPGARFASANWTDAAGDFWLFGGNGLDSLAKGVLLNDLWKYTVSTGQWTWESGANLAGQSGVYGSLGQAAAGSVPGAREYGVSWTDATGNLWLFGGFGFDSGGTQDYLNDLWMYSPSTGLWTWVSGANVGGPAGQYGTQGVAAAGNTPGARASPLTWTDSSGNLWLFGGNRTFPASGPAYYSDLWEFNPSTQLWTWISGPNTFNQPGVYGTQGVAAAGNIPGSRSEAVSWLDSHGNFWLFGGEGYDSAASFGSLNDLWEFSAQSGLWSWQGGSTVANGLGVYGTLGIPAPANIPGSRRLPIAWTDQGAFWMFGGLGNSATGNGYLNDLWQYVPR